MTNTTWIDEKVGAFEEEFGIHLTKSAGELGFAKDFLSTALQEAHQHGVEEANRRVLEWVAINSECLDEPSERGFVNADDLINFINK